MDCPLCLDFFSDVQDDYFVTTRNGHIFHFSCLSRWDRSSCPTCRQCPIGRDALIRLRNVDTNRPVSPVKFEVASSAPSLDLVASASNLSNSDNDSDYERFLLVYNTIQSGHLSQVTFLINIGYVDIRMGHAQNDGQTLAHLSAQLGHLQVLQCLHECGATLQEKDFRGLTPLDYALEADQQAVVDYLLNFQSQQILIDRGEFHDTPTTVDDVNVSNGNTCMSPSLSKSYQELEIAIATLNAALEEL